MAEEVTRGVTKQRLDLNRFYEGYR